MRKIKLFLIAGGLVCALAGVSRADLFESRSDKTVTVRFTQSVAIGVSTAAVLVDLSNTTTWPHKETRSLNVVSVRIEVDKAAASTGTVKLGVVNFVNASTGSVTWFTGKSFESLASNDGVESFRNYDPPYLNLRVVSTGNATNGTTPFVFSNDTTAGSTTYQTDVNLPSTNANSAPGVGDIVMSVSNGTGAVRVTVEIQYFSE